MNQQPQIIYPTSNFSFRVQSPQMVSDSDNYQFAKESREQYMEDHIFTYVINLCKVISAAEE